MPDPVSSYLAATAEARLRAELAGADRIEVAPRLARILSVAACRHELLVAVAAYAVVVYEADAARVLRATSMRIAPRMPVVADVLTAAADLTPDGTTAPADATAEAETTTPARSKEA